VTYLYLQIMSHGFPAHGIIWSVREVYLTDIKQVERVTAGCTRLGEVVFGWLTLCRVRLL